MEELMTYAAMMGLVMGSLMILPFVAAFIIFLFTKE